MENSGDRRENAIPQERTFALLSLVEGAQDITVRDDQYDFSILLDAAKNYQRGRFRFRLIDSGLFEGPQLERLTEEGVDLYTSDDVRPSVLELDMINTAARKGKAFVAFFHHDRLMEADDSEGFSLQDLMIAGLCGIYVHISNRENARDLAVLDRIAYSCNRGGSWLVYYHHGPCDPSLVELGKNGAWIHISEESFQDEQSSILLKDIVRSARAAGSNLVLYAEKDEGFSLISDALRAGAVVKFRAPLFDRLSPLKALEKEIMERKPDFRAYYLYPHFFQ
jgi:hypothetical protein